MLETGDDDVIELQALGLVDRHHLNRPMAVRRWTLGSVVGGGCVQPRQVTAQVTRPARQRGSRVQQLEEPRCIGEAVATGGGVPVRVGAAKLEPDVLHAGTGLRRTLVPGERMTKPPPADATGGGQPGAVAQQSGLGDALHVREF